MSLKLYACISGKLHSTLEEHHLSKAHSFLFFILYPCDNRSNSHSVPEVAIPTTKFLASSSLFCAV